MTTINSEPLLTVDETRISLFPLRYPDIYDMYKLHRSSFWTPNEVDLTNDINDWNTKLTSNQKYYLEMVLAFFASSDFIVNENETSKHESIKVLEYQFLIRDKMAREDVHSETYANMIETYIRDPVRAEFLRDAVKNIPSVKKKSDWFKRYIHSGTFAEKEVAGAITEGIFFSGSFCAIFYLKKQGLMTGLCQNNELISRDEGMHRDFQCDIYNRYIVNKIPEEQVIQMIRDAVEIEMEFCSDSLPVDLIGMNKTLMCRYIKYTADHLCNRLLGRLIYNETNPFSWMTLISMETKPDFFSMRVNNYAKKLNSGDNKIEYTDDY